MSAAPEQGLITAMKATLPAQCAGPKAHCKQGLITANRLIVLAGCDGSLA